ncbi:MAG: hypothetical protein WB507_01670 [Solirubrobacterales bacterium]
MGLLLITASAASANGASHEFTTTFGSTSPTSIVSNPYPLAGADSIAVDQATGDVYVADANNNRIEKFTSTGHFILMFGKEVNRSKVELYEEQRAKHEPVTVTSQQQDVCDAGETCQEGTPTTLGSSIQHGFSHPDSVAVDNSPAGQGDVYVTGTSGSSLSLFKLNSSGEFVTTWRTEGVSTSDEPYSKTVAVDESNGTVYFDGGGGGNVELNPHGEAVSDIPSSELFGTFFTVNASGDLYFASSGVLEAGPNFEIIGFLTNEAGTGFSLDSSLGDFYLDTGTAINHYDANCEAARGPCQPIDSFGAAQLAAGGAMAVDESSGAVYALNQVGEASDVAVFTDIRPQVTTEPPTELTETSATLHGAVDPEANGRNHGTITKCFFEYGTTNAYGHTVPCEAEVSLPYTDKTEVQARIASLTHLSNLPPQTQFHYRLIAENEMDATGFGHDQPFLTTAVPAIKGIFAGELTATSAHLSSRVDPNGLPSTCRFEYGTTTAYGHTEPCPAEITDGLFQDHTLDVSLTGLTEDVTYHYRLVAENADGETTTADDTFAFFPPSCPNQTVRQQTHAPYLPDCRAYELVSPPNAGATQLFPGGPNTGYATDPSRLSFVGANGTLPESGGSPIDGNGDLYVATRTDTGWVSRYVGLPSSEAALDGGPPQGPPDSGFSGSVVGFGLQPSGASGPAKIQNAVLTDPSMDAFLEFNDGNQNAGTSSSVGNPTPTPSFAPFVFGADGQLHERWPTDLGAVSESAHALDCPPINLGGFNNIAYNYCPDDVTASADLTHFVFADEAHLFAPEGQLAAPGSVYDNDTTSGALAVASKLPGGTPIPAQPTDRAGDPLQIPAVSADGSHILIAAPGTGPCGFSTCPEPPCGIQFSAAMRCPPQPSNLYMRVDDAVTYDVSQGHNVSYLGMTSDGSRVFFTSEEHLTAEDSDHGGASLYMWSEAAASEQKQPLTLVSRGDNEGKLGEPGNTDACDPAATNGSPWTSRCGVVTYSGTNLCQLPGGVGGNCLSDSSVASESGDVFFFSPEQLDGSRGIPDQPNLYDYRGGRLHFVAAFTSGSFCPGSRETQHNAADFCSNTPIVRMQVTPDGTHMAFVTASQVTPYDNAGHLEMYTYEPADEKLTCVSCNPSGASPEFNVQASQDGLFLTNDGRAFFSTEESLVHDDTNHAEDVYEYVEGRPQLITPGTGDTRIEDEQGVAVENPPGLDGVSANGTDVYFSTYDTLVPQDVNGSFLKFYDARTDGGFASPPPPPPCDAADECHGEGTAPPPALQIESSAHHARGNADRSAHHKKARVKRHHRRAAARRKHRVRSSVVLSASGQSRAVGASKQSNFASSAPRAKTKHLGRAARHNRRAAR